MCFSLFFAYIKLDVQPFTFQKSEIQQSLVVSRVCIGIFLPDGASQSVEVVYYIGTDYGRANSRARLEFFRRDIEKSIKYIMGGLSIFITDCYDLHDRLCPP